MKKKFWHTKSLRVQLTAVLLVISLMLAVSVLVYASFTQQTLLAEIRNANLNMLRFYADQIDQLCVRSNRCISTLLLEYNLCDEDIALRLNNELAKDIILYENQVSFFFSNPAQQEYIFKTASTVTSREREEFTSFFYALDGKDSSDGWELHIIGEQAYLTSYQLQSGCYLGAWFSLDSGLRFYSTSRFEEESVLLFTTADGSILCANREGYTGANIDESETFDDFLLLDVALREGGLNLALAIPYHVILSGLRMVQIVELLTLLAMLAAIPILLFYLRRLVIHPMDELVGAMDEVRGGDLSVTIPPTQEVEEFQKVAAAFNSMVTQIHDLKIDIYEKELTAQRLELERLQLEVKPHFYLNCLNIIYNLAEGEEYKLIQALCKAQVEYFRYMLKAEASTVTIGEEFAHIRNYLHIQQLRFPDRFNIGLELNSELEDMPIPPLTLHVFVENAVRYAVGQDELLLQIDAHACGEDHIEIIVQDDGPGFPAEILKKLQNGESLPGGSGEHVGIANTIQRLRLIYANDCEIQFSNRIPHGARIRIRIPKGEIA